MSRDELQVEAEEKERQSLIMSTIASAAPWIGGPIANVMNARSSDRKLKRVYDTIDVVAKNAARIESDATKKYVQTEDFEDLLEATLRRASEERKDYKRSIYGEFIIRELESPLQKYDEQEEMLKTIERLRLEHIQVLRAFAQEPDSELAEMMGSIGGTLNKRVPQVHKALQAEVVEDLKSMRLITSVNTTITITGSGANDLRGAVTPRGARIIEYTEGVDLE